jgi:hypothetical protein
MLTNPSPSIFLIEDSPADADLIQRVLLKQQPILQIFTARDGEEALKTIAQWETGNPLPIVILLDLKLPKVDGLEVLQAIKSHERFRVIPVVVLTSSNQIQDIHKAYFSGANSYILKAIDFDEFSKSISMIYHYWCSLNIRPE